MGSANDRAQVASGGLDDPTGHPEPEADRRGLMDVDAFELIDVRAA